MSAGVPLHLDGAVALKIEIEAQRCEFDGILFEQGVFAVRKHQPFGKQQLLTHRRTAAEHLQVVFVKYPFTGAAHVHHHEPSAQQAAT